MPPDVPAEHLYTMRISPRSSLTGRTRPRLRRTGTAASALAALLVLLAVAAGSAQAGVVVGAGRDENRNLGLGYNLKGLSDEYTATEVTNAVEVCGAGLWGAARLQNGTVVQWGGNEGGQSGTGIKSHYHPVPVVVPGISDARQIACSGEHIAVVLTNGTVDTWGAGTRGQDCDGAEDFELHPYTVPGISTAVEAAAGGADTWVRLANGTVVGCGEDNKGQLGDGGGAQARTTPVTAQMSHISQIAAGGLFGVGAQLIALTEAGQVLAVGQNDYGQLGDGTHTSSAAPVLVQGLPPVARVAASWSHTLALTTSGLVYSWGEDSRGELGYPAGQSCGNAKRAIACSLSPHLVPGLADVGLIAAGGRHSLATVEGRLYAWGANGVGQLGDGTQIDKPAPTATGLDEVTSLGTEGDTFAVTAQPLQPALTASGEPGGLTVDWIAGAVTGHWAVKVRPAGTKGWASGVILPANARSNRLSEPAGSYEVSVQASGYGQRVIVAEVAQP